MQTPKAETKPGPANASRMRLDAVVRGKLVKPVRVLIAGTEGIGKSTFAANAPAPIFIGAEDGTSELDVARFPEPHSWLDVRAAVHALEDDLTHPYKTVAIDTLDWLEPLCWDQVCKTKRDKNGKLHDHIEWYPYGAGFAAALDEWRALLADLDRVRAARNMNVILIAHSWIKSFKNPQGDDFDRFELKLNAKAGGLIKEWADAVLFANYETLTTESNGRAKGVSTGARFLHTQRTAAWDAKNRYDLPPDLPLDWHAFEEAVAAHRPADPARLKAQINALLPGADGVLSERVTAAVQTAGDNAAELARILNKLQAQVSLNGGQQS